LRSRLRKQVRGAVEVQEGEPARRAADVVDLRDGLLAAVAALVQVHRGAQPVVFVGQRVVVDLEDGAGPVGGDALGLRGPGAGEGPARLESRVDLTVEVLARDQHQSPLTLAASELADAVTGP